jgi:hypothetical protein
MHRHVIAHRQRLSRGVKHRTRIIAPFFDVRRERCPAQRCAHLFRNRMKDALENFDLDRVYFLSAHPPSVLRQTFAAPPEHFVASENYEIFVDISGEHPQNLVSVGILVQVMRVACRKRAKI